MRRSSIGLVGVALLAGVGLAAQTQAQPPGKPAPAKVETVRGGSGSQPGERKPPGKAAPAKVAAPNAPDPAKSAPAKPGSWTPAASASVPAAKTANVKQQRPSRGKRGSTKAAKVQPPKPAEIVRSNEPSGPGVRVSDDITMLPNGRDTTGCQRYSMSSRGFGPVQATFYRTHRGDFTTDRNEASCSG